MCKARKFNILISAQNTMILLFVLYFLLGLIIYKDYGICWDETIERETSISNYVYVMGKLMSTQYKPSIKQVLHTTPNLMHINDRYYGVALQSLTVLFEHMQGFESANLREVFLIRHFITFIIFFLGSIFFYLILRRRFGNTYFPVLGTLFYILYPRFFGESFYNIKDIVFFSCCVISSYFILRWLEDKDKKCSIVLAALTLAIATNTRILGISILLLAGGFVFLQGLWNREVFTHNMRKFLKLCVMTFAFYIVITPFTWENPLKNMIDTFFHFLRFPGWNGMHFYLGEMITSDVPWHYIPMWMGITIPILYIILFLIGICIMAVSIVVFIKKRKKTPHLYDMFFVSMFVFILFGFILLGINIYEGWRHAYMIFLPFLFIVVCGLKESYLFFQDRKRGYRVGLICIIVTSLLHSSIWMVINHPYQYVYFNLVGRWFAEKNFTLDYWNISNYDMIKRAIEYDDKPIITINFPHYTMEIMTQEDKRSVIRTEMDVAEYYIQCSRIAYDDRVQGPGEDFIEIDAITVNGMKIARLFRRDIPLEVNYDLDAWSKVVDFYSNVDSYPQFLHDGYGATHWTTGRNQQAGDYMVFRFDEAVHYNYFYLESFDHSCFPRDLLISTSLDGEVWNMAQKKGTYNSHFIFESEPYIFLRLENNSDADKPFSVNDMNFGYVEKD